MVVKNIGDREGDEVVFLFHKHSRSAGTRNGNGNGDGDGDGDGDDPLAIKELIGFERVSLAAGASATVQFNVTARTLSTVLADGRRQLVAGAHELVFDRGHSKVFAQPFEVELLSRGRAAGLKFS